MSIFVKKHYGSNRSWLFGFFIHIAIFIRASFSAIARLLKIKTVKQNKTEPESGTTVIAGSLHEYNEVTELLNQAGIKEKLLLRMDPACFQNLDETISIDTPENIYSNKDIKKIIFCEGTLSFKDIIETIPVIPKHISIQLFSNGCHAIIGSDDRNVAGNFILKSQESA